MSSSQRLNVAYLNRFSFAKESTVVAPPNEWPTTATLLKSSLPLNKNKHRIRELTHNFLKLHMLRFTNK